MMILIIAILIFLLILLCREYYKLNRMLDEEITEHNKLKKRYEILEEYVHYYSMAHTSGVDRILTLQEYKRINKL